jgi:NAD(P)-dependent dehydrogenase (short-subunit alcohol dehydrogenase family)
VPTVLVTGASRGIGLEFVRQYAGDGWRVIATCRSPQEAAELRALGDDRPAVEVHRLDVGDEGSIRELGAAFAADAIDLLINNAACGERSRPLAEVSYSSFERALRVNAFATLAMAQAFLEPVARSGGRTLATISSRMGSLAENREGGRYVYRTSKAAANMLVRTLAVDLAERGIRVVSLHPGWVRTRLGGPQAPLARAESVAGMRRVLAGLDDASSGSFLTWEGRPVPW